MKGMKDSMKGMKAFVLLLNLLLLSLLTACSQRDISAENPSLVATNQPGQDYLKIESTSFDDNGPIPSKYTCKGDNINPSLIIKNIPSRAKTLAIIVEDETADNFVHWMIWNIPVRDMINEGTAPGTEGKNSFGTNKYSGPCPPSGTHYYVFRVYALDSALSLTDKATRQQFYDEVLKHTISSGSMKGFYSK